MARISELPPAAPLTGTETLPIVQDSETRQVPFAQVMDDITAKGNEQAELVTTAGASAIAIATEQANAATFATLQRAFITIDGRNAYFSVSPRSAWNGTAGTGFVTPPVDPVRTTAKPAVRLVVPALQRFSNHLVVGVLAAANNRGRLDNLGMAAVRCHYEGNVATCLEPSWRSYLDVNGQQQSAFAFWFVLVHNGVNSANTADGGADVYFEGIPLDSTMQNRVHGPFRFFPRATLHDTELTIAPSLAEVPGSRYQTFLAAFNFIRTNNRHFPLVTATEAGNYDLGQMPSAYTTRSHTIIRATAPVTFTKSSYTTDANGQFRPRLDPLWFQGSNITFDFRFVNEIFRETTVTQPNTQHAFSGVRFTNSGGRNTLWRKGQYPSGFRVRGNPFFMECTHDNLGDPCVNASLVRNCTISMAIRDVVTDAFCVIGTRTDDLDSSWWNAEVNAMTVTYGGASATATLELSGGNDASSRTFTARENGSVVGTFTVGNTEALFTTGTNYDVADVVGWLNGLSGWSATLLDDTRRASALARPGTLGTAFAAVSVKSVTLPLVTIFDVHSDWYQQNNTTVNENVVVMNNISTRLVAQDIFLTGSGGARDFLFINNAFHQKDEGEFAPAFDSFMVINSQCARTHSHVVIAHTSWAKQGLSLRTDGANAYNPDSYCLVANNVGRIMTWGGTADADLAIRDNHLETGATAPANATGTTIGGTVASMFVDAASGAFEPIGELLTNPKPSKLRLPARGPVRQALAPCGAVA